MRLLDENPELSQRKLAKALGISVGSVHYLINALIQMGFVKLGNFSASQDKRRYSYILTPKGLAEKGRITRDFLERKRAEYDALRDEIDALEGELTESQSVGSRGA